VSVEIIIPWSWEEARVPLLETVLDHLEAWEWTLAIDEDEPFSRGRAINRAVNDSSAEVVLVNDADCIVPEDQIVRAIALALELPGPVLAFTDYTRLNQAGAPERVVEGAPSQSCFAIRRHSFLTVGGYDERFEGWGYEDVAFNVACSRLWPLRRIPGPLYHLWHGERRPDDSPVSCDPDVTARNLELLTSEYVRG
jgi:hypothetical protein